ncbi:rRNA methyltransferase [Candidatus Peregrinibacteria bacterium CG10_big_fil_rev_8_21_14_0_10_49_16]|nr:MAG: rRNA methyltransferase [Candidatus Peregrinibacteria bacterium CG22_combo_CG10-13_8_21_14_all_49_11]PIR51876.1 MAG: rRNA methyltransferase [Candidatus Peregrinibacteria bacterium CG10_big_fil_rev_8_21_14_0_10_49_16]
MEISSPQNPKIKAAVKLRSSARERRETGLFVLEGAREIARALACRYEVHEVFVCTELLSSEASQVLKTMDHQPMDVTNHVYEKIAVREEKDGIVVVMQAKKHALADLTLSSKPFILAIEGVENPGNVGALLRTADGAGVDAVCLVETPGDVYNPHTIRASIGTVFSVPIAVCEREEFSRFCKEHTLTLFGAALDPHALSPYKADFTVPCAIILGNEANGLHPDTHAACDTLIQLPMRGIADSLNVSVTGGILAYEVYRQRQ